MQEILAETAARASASCVIRLGAGALDRLPEAVSGTAGALLVSDRHVASEGWLEQVAERCRTAVPVLATSVLEPGEREKTLDAARRLWEAWVAAGAGRDAVVVAVGGGLVTDLAGFAAACFLRGVPWVAVPSSVVGMADAAIGGKTAVNLPGGKNLVGAFHAPRAVVADLELLRTLPEAPYREGWSEVVKAGAVGDAWLLERLREEAPAVGRRELGALEELLARAVRVKVDVVAADERERGRREILNFGHTVAHGLESATDHALGHGRAVAIGMRVEAELATELGRLPEGAAELLRGTTDSLGIPSELPEGLSRARLAAALEADKKRRAGRTRLALPDGLGRHGSTPGVEVEPARILDALERLR